MSAKSTFKPGRYSPDITPWVNGMAEALDDPDIFEVVAMKSAQIAWTDGVLLNHIGKRIDVEPCAMIVLFSKEGAAKMFEREKLIPMIEATPRLAAKIPVHKSRDRNNKWDYKGFTDGFLKLVGSNSPDSVKSTPAPFVAVEEPDDANTNVKKQGDSITLLRERLKGFRRRKLVFGGTPTVEGFSAIAAAYAGSDQRQFWVPCPHCGESQVLACENIVFTRDPALRHEIFGDVVLESARYRCVHTGCLWTNGEKNRAVRKGEWRASAAFHGIAGFAINEAYSPFPGSTLQELVKKRLTAEHWLRNGDDAKMRSYRNNSEGLPYAYSSSVPTADKLKERASDYQELIVQPGGIVLTAGVDVQHDRLAVVIRAWGRGEESWLVWWGEIYGRTMLLHWGDDGSISKEHSPVWLELDQLLKGAFLHANGSKLRIRAATVDSGDGQTQDAVYSYVRRRPGFLAGKGESHDPKKAIFTPPSSSIDTTAKHKAHPSGVRPYMIGTQVAKDLLLGVNEQAGRIKLTGNGPGRMHMYRDVRPDYWDQVTAEVKIPHKTIPGRMVWDCKSGRRNEALDCEVMCLHAARSLKLNLWRDDHWDAEEAAINQPTLFAADAPLAVVPQSLQAPANETSEGNAEPPETAAAPTPAPAAQPQRLQAASPVAAPKPGGWSAKNWRR